MLCYDCKLLEAMIVYEEIKVEGERSAVREGWKLGGCKVWLDMYEKRKMIAHNNDELASMDVYRLVKGKCVSYLLDFELTIDLSKSWGKC